MGLHPASLWKKGVDAAPPPFFHKLERGEICEKTRHSRVAGFSQAGVLYPKRQIVSIPSLSRFNDRNDQAFRLKEGAVRRTRQSAAGGRCRFASSIGVPFLKPI